MGNKLNVKDALLKTAQATKKYVDDNKFSGDYNDLINKPTMNWEENDTSDTSYICGRTHWHEVVYGPDTEQGLIAQAIDDFSYGTEDTICYDILLEAADGRPEVFLDVGETYTIVVKNRDDGTENTYQCMCDYHPYMAETYVLGDEQFTNMPIVIIYDLENINSICGFSAAMLNEGSYDVQVFGTRTVKHEVYHKLSMDYLPDSVATKEYIDNKFTGLQMVQITQADYDALPTKDANTLYIII